MDMLEKLALEARIGYLEKVVEIQTQQINKIIEVTSTEEKLLKLHGLRIKILEDKIEA